MLTSPLWIAAALVLAPATSPKIETTTDAIIEQCEVISIRDQPVPGADPGVLVKLNVSEGNLVKKGQELARVDDREAQAQVIVKQLDFETAQQKADSDIEIRYAEEGANVSKASYDKLRLAGNKGAVTEIEIMRAMYEWEKSKLLIEKSREENIAHNLAAKAKKAEVDAALVSANRRSLLAPFDGKIKEVIRHVGEWVSPGDPVVQIVRIDRLRVNGNLDATKWDPLDIEDRNVTVEVQLPHDRTVKVPGRIVFVSPVVALGHEVAVAAEIDSPLENNRPVVRAGCTARMIIHVNQPIEPDKRAPNRDADEKPPARGPGKAPAATPAKAGPGLPAKQASAPTKATPELPGKAPAATPPKATGATPSKATGATPSKTTTATPTKATLDAADKSPTVTPGKAPADAASKSPATPAAPAKATSDAPTKPPAGSPASPSSKSTDKSSAKS